MLPTIGGNDKSKLDPSGSFLSRMLGRSPSKGAVAPQQDPAASGQIKAQHPSMASPGKGPAGVLNSSQPPQGSLKTTISQGLGASNTWSIGSGKEQAVKSLRTPSAKNLEEAAGRAASATRAGVVQAANSALVQRMPSAQRLTPLQPVSPGAQGPKVGFAGTADKPAPKADADEEEEELAGLSREELKQMAMTLAKEKQALKQQYEVLSGSGKPGSTTGMDISQAGPKSPAANAKSPRPSGVTFAQQPTAHRNSVLVVEFDNRKRSSVVQTVDQFRAGLPEDVDEMKFIEPTKAGTKSSAALESGPSLDPLQAQHAADAAAAEVKRQLLLSKSMKVAEDEAKKAAEAKRQAEAAAAAAAAAAAGPAKPISSKMRYKLLSSYPLMSPNMRREEWSLSQFAVEKRLHKGYASEVYKARDTQSGELMAVKIYNLPALGELNKVQLIREIRLHGACAHRNIIELYVAFQEDSRVILAQKYADGGDLLKALHHAGGRLTEHSAVSMVIHPLLACMVYLHGKGIIHRDIKPENILFDEGILKVADFGLALNVNEENAVTRAGTLHYMAPEVVKNPLKDHPDDFKSEQRYHYNMVVDSWAIGCLAFELLAGYPPFTANTQSQVVHNINHLEIAYPKRMSEDAISFMKAALERFPGERATTTELIKHPWIMQHMRRGSTRNLTLQPQPGGLSVGKNTTDFATGLAEAKKQEARRAADHGPKQAIMAPF